MKALFLLPLSLLLVSCGNVIPTLSWDPVTRTYRLTADIVVPEEQVTEEINQDK